MKENTKVVTEPNMTATVTFSEETLQTCITCQYNLADFISKSEDSESAIYSFEDRATKEAAGFPRTITVFKERHPEVIVFIDEELAKFKKSNVECSGGSTISITAEPPNLTCEF